MRKALGALGAFIVFFVAAFVLGVLVSNAGGCTAEQLAAYSHDHPKSAATTQAIEKFEQKGDKAAEVIIRVAPTIEAGADTAKGMGVPGTDWIKYGASLVGGAALWWLGRRKPVTALAQVVNGIEDAFPNKTEEQKLKLAAAQDESTKALVGSLKTST